MCGFLGTYNCENQPESEFGALLRLASKRGPDESKVWTGDRVQFGFNRLSILDLSETGSQPMHAQGGRYVIMLNGEIYNHGEIRAELKDHRFIGTGDTETVCAAIERWGIEDTINKLDGMFAIAVYDKLSAELTLVRDFAGIKPLFYGYRDGAVVFGSQYDQLLSHPILKGVSIREDVLKLYLTHHYMPAPMGIYQHTFQLLPGELIKFNADGELYKKRYWTLPENADDLITDRREALRLVDQELQKAVNDQMLSDVPLGAFLSGGVDSPLVCAAAVKKDKGLKVFSIGSDSEKHDESEQSIKYASNLGLDQKLWKLNAADALTYWDEAMSAIHEPLADFSVLPTYLVSKLAREKLTVALSGDGGDELFLGYDRFWSLAKNIRYSQMPGLLRKGIYIGDKLLTGNKRVNDNVLFDSISSAHRTLHSRFRTDQVAGLFPGLSGVVQPEDWNVYDYGDPNGERDLLWKMQNAEFYGMMQKTLRKVDLASMENSLEVRVPFLQKSFIEASLRVDPYLSYGDGKKKQLLKDLLTTKFSWYKDDGVKKGFNVPLGKWIREDLEPVFKERILEGQLSNLGMEKKQAERMFEEHIGRGMDRKWPLFTLYALERFMNKEAQ